MFASQSFTREISIFMNEEVKIDTVKGEVIEGTLRAYDPDTLSLILENARTGGEEFKRLMISGGSVSKVYLKEKRVDFERLKTMMEKSFPNLVEYRKELGVILVMNRIRVTEEGVEGEPGPATDRVNKIFGEFMRGGPASPA
ncbi:MAG: Lsm family RNA-binding protein [Candidatus Geothermarchaeales archaeon]